MTKDRTWLFPRHGMHLQGNAPYDPEKIRTFEFQPTHAHIPAPLALQGGVDTSFIAEHEDSLLERVAPGTDELCLAALIYAAPHASGEPSASTKAPCPEPWRQPSAFRVNHPARASVGFGHAPATGGLELDLVGAGGGVTLEGAALAEGSGLGAEARVEVRRGRSWGGQGQGVRRRGGI